MSLIRKIRRSKPAQKCTYNVLNWVMRKNADLQTLNCGLVPKSGFQVGEEYGENAISRLGLELYHYVAQQYPTYFSEKRLLEIGRGRGGGAAYIADRFQPKSVVGIDFSTQSIRLSKNRYKANNLSFEIGDASDLRFDNASFDFLLSIETSHMIQQKEKFFSEAFRITKPGGCFMYLDFIYAKPSSDHSIEKVELAIQQTDWHISRHIDLTESVLEALKTASPIREALIEKKCPRLLRNQFKEFCMTSQSNTYRAFVEGRTKYYFYVLKKPE
ncbi:MAG: class I SAM-dependent methyltransferase [Verrucomicrobia bacterium]|nr:class I SAM-dependent methyltransferase [Verrucomicrobiota bacterium]